MPWQRKNGVGCTIAPSQYISNALRRCGEFRVVERPLPVHRDKTSGCRQGIAMTQRHLQSLQQTPLRMLIALNGLWAMACVWVAFGAGQSPTPVGMGDLLVQAVFVVGLATLQTKGLRQLGA